MLRQSKENIVGAGLLTVCILEYIGKPFADGARPVPSPSLKRAGAPLRLNSRRSLCVLTAAGTQGHAKRKGHQQCGCACQALVNGEERHCLRWTRTRRPSLPFRRRVRLLYATPAWADGVGATARQGQAGPGEGRAPMNRAARGATGSLGHRIKLGPARRSARACSPTQAVEGALATSPRPPRISS